MGQYNVKVRPNILGMLLVVLGIGCLTVYLGIYLSSRDPVWFAKGFDQKPYLIVIYDHGQRKELIAGQPGYDQLAAAVTQSLDQGVARLSGIGFSDASVEDAYGKYLSVEAFFERPVKLHTYFNTGQPTQMLFPITGRHSNLKVVLLGNNDRFAVNVPALKTMEPIRTVLQSLGYDVNRQE